VAGPPQHDRNLDPGIKLILQEIRDLRIEMRAERQEDRRQAIEDRRQAMDDRRQAMDDRRQAVDDRRQANEDRRRSDEERRRSDRRFDRLLRDFRQDSARREAKTQRMFKEIRTVGLAIVKTLNRHTRLLEGIDRKLGGLGNGRVGGDNGGRPPRTR